MEILLPSFLMPMGSRSFPGFEPPTGNTLSIGGSPYLFAPLALIRSALCPLHFRAKKIASIPELANLTQLYPDVAQLEVGDCLRHESLFPFCDANRNRKIGCQLVAAPFGLAPTDVEALFAVYTYAYKLQRSGDLPDDLTLTLTTNQIARLARLPNTNPKDARRIQSRLFRLSAVKLTNTHVWNRGEGTTTSLTNCHFFSIKEMSLLTEPFRPVILQLSHTFADLLKGTPTVAFDLAAARLLKSPAKRRLFLLVSREGWNQRDSQVYAADDFAVHQLGFAKHSDRRRDATQRRTRLHSLRSLLKKFEDRDLVRPYKPWQGYFATPSRGPLAGIPCVRWSRGPAIAVKGKTPSVTLTAADDALYDQIKMLPDDDGKPLPQLAYQRLFREHGRDRLQKHVRITLTQHERMPQSFRRSPLAAFLDRVKHDHPAPAWYSPELAKPQVPFDEIELPQFQKLYDSTTLRV